MFAGIGGFRSGLTRAGGFQCVGHCEIDKYANASYTAIYEPGKEERYYPDATKIDPADLPDFELLCGGFPCQAFSNAGRRRGFADARGTLFFEIARLAQAKRPAYLLLENVPGLLSHDKGKTFSVILSALDDLGYHVEWSVLNSKHFGVPQSRRRLFIIGYLDPRCAGKILPVFGTGGKALVQVLGGPQGSRIYDADGVACTQTAGAGGMGGKTGLYLVGFNRKDGIVGKRDTAIPLNASDFRGINRNQTQNAVLVDLCSGHPKQTDAARCLTARYGQTTLSNRKGERSGVLLIKEATIPICPHLLFPPITDPKHPEQDKKVKEMSLRLLESCQQLNVYGPIWTDDMWKHIYRAGDLGIPVMTDQKTIGRTPPRRSDRKER